MFRFAHTEVFYLLLLVPLLAGVYALTLRRGRNALRRLGNETTLRALMPDRSPRRCNAKFVLTLLALALLIVALARPQFGARLGEQRRTGMELMIAVDVSNSMLARDFTPNRLEHTKAAIERLLEELDQDRVGLIAFAGQAFVQLPVTSDHATARSFAAQLSTDMISRQGTDLAAAIELAIASFSPGSEGSRALIVISDGENHESDPLPAAERAHEAGITIYTIGIGTSEGVPIPLAGGEMMRDGQGEMVVTRLDEAMLERLALTTDGAYLRADDATLGLEQIMGRIEQTHRRELRTAQFEQWDEQFGYPLAAALALLLLEMLVLPRKNPRLARFNVFN